MGEFNSFCFQRLTRIDRQLSTTWRSLEEPGWCLSRTPISSQRSQNILENMTDVLFSDKNTPITSHYTNTSRGAPAEQLRSRKTAQDRLEVPARTLDRRRVLVLPR